MKRHFKVTASKNAANRPIKASTQDYELINYFDVWGNPEDGFDVNDLDRTGEIITITDDATDEDIVDGLINMGFLKSDAKGRIYVEDMGDGFIELSVEETGEPIGRLELVTASTNILCYRDNNVSQEDVRELVLAITNESSLYPQATAIRNNLHKKYQKGNYDPELATKAWQYLADEGTRFYDKKYGSGNGSLSWLNPATRHAIAEELRDYYEDWVMED